MVLFRYILTEENFTVSARRQRVNSQHHRHVKLRGISPYLYPAAIFVRNAFDALQPNAGVAFFY